MATSLSEKGFLSERNDAARHLSLLIEIGQVFSGELSTRVAFEQVLDLLKQRHSVIRGAVALLDARSQEIRVEVSTGLSDAGRFTRYRVGEGITGRVVETGKPIVVPKVSREPMFLNRAGKRDLNKQEITYMCVPVVVKSNAVGALGVDLHFKADRDYESELKCLGLIADMMAQAIKAEHLVDDERRRLIDENTHLLEELKERYDFSNIIGTGGPMRQVYEQIAQVAHSNTTVLIRGESGTGKELIAHAIHYNSPRAQKPFIKVNCAALPETLIESELFGYEKGAFTGAHALKKGRFDLAEGGTLFLDEIGDMNLSTQVKLLRVLQEKEFERLGGTSTIRTNVRLIAGTHKNLEQAMVEGKFREDFYYRLNVFAIFVPALRERKSDLLLLADHFLQKYAREHKKDIRRISTPAIDMLTAYHWPGNVRELENVIERAVLVCDENAVHGHHLPPTLQTAQASGTITTLSLSQAVVAFEKDIVLDALKTTRGNRAKAARLLGTTERIINYKVRKYGIDSERFRS
ncbi:MAG TPA: sigma 54-interacting transcriptional regulator [Terriglobia bacterium]|nr:sigma 54-interacting transcriptional regulator [Terriglobia bacterium]